MPATRSALCKFRRTGRSFCQVDVTPVGGSPFGPWGRTFFLEGPGRPAVGCRSPRSVRNYGFPGSPSQTATSACHRGEVALAASALAEVHRLVPSRWLSSRTPSRPQRRLSNAAGYSFWVLSSSSARSNSRNLAARAGKEQKPWAHRRKSIRRTCSSASITR